MNIFLTFLIFHILAEQVIGGLDKAVMSMKKGEVAQLTIAPEHAFGSSELKQELAVVPPNSTVYYEVELVSFVKEKESWDMNTQEKIEAAGKKKEEGNALFKAGKYALASKRYEKVIFACAFHLDTPVDLVCHSSLNIFPFAIITGGQIHRI